jgi:hypothetical protein
MNGTSQVACNCVWNQRAWGNTSEYQYEYCQGCGTIKSFHWKSFWKRLKGLFKNETLK